MLKDKVELLELPDGEDFKLVRMIGPSKRVGYHMIPVFKQDGTPVMNKFKQQVRIPKVCLAFNSKTGEMEEDNEKKCPYCRIDPDPLKIEVHSNGIDRELAEDFNLKKAKKNYSKKENKKKEFSIGGGEWHVADSKSSKKLTPVRFWRITASIGTKISDYTSLNKRKNKKGKVVVYNPNHEKYGFDLNVKFDNSKKNPSEKYSCVKDERTELTEEEMEYLLWDIDIEKPEEFKVAKKEAESFKKRMDAAEGSSKKRSKDEDDEEEDYEGDEDEDEDDEDERPSKKKGKKSSKKSKSDDWEDEEEEDDEDDEDEDEDDEDEDDEDEKSSKKKSKDKKSSKKSKKRSKDEDDDDDDEEDDDSWDSDEDEDDEDDEPRKKKSKKSSKKDKKSKSKSKKRSKDEDDDDDEDDDADWDDD